MDAWAELLQVIERHWGFRTLRPLQEQAMRAVLAGRDSLVVLPTGGGKSLCYQAPAAGREAGRTTVVVSPLISLMKDQVDSLRACDVPAVQIDSSQSPRERHASEAALVSGAVRLVFVSPERLMMSDFWRLLQRVGVRTFAIDEAHCISHWGHDFRPEYRQLNRLRELAPGASVHAYTATATERVRQDIIAQLGLADPEVLVGNFDRHNLTYRVVPRRDLMKQATEVLNRHPGEAGIIYCIRRTDVDELAGALRKQGHRARAYHAGLTPDERRAAQEAFSTEECDLIVATVAFGMGIDRSNIRFVLHAAMPKSIEHYQQESGRAGRDGLEAECVLLYSGSDTLLWKSIVEKSAAESGEVDPAFLPGALQHIDDMDRYCRGAVCRHRALVGYFGQDYAADACEACDLCLGETELVSEAVIVAQKILSCVARVREGFGINHVVGVLRGEKTENIRKRGHDRLSTFGLLREHGKADVRDWVYQLLGQKVLLQVGDDYPILRLNPASWEVMRGQRSVRLVQLARGKKKQKEKTAVVSWEGVDQELFEALRRVRRQLAEERRVPPYVIFTDATLRQLARVKPATPEQMRQVSGVGDAKLRDFGDRFLQTIATHGGRVPPAAPVLGTDQERARAFALFRSQTPLAEVLRQLQQPREVVLRHLCDFIRAERPASLSPWLEDQTYQRIVAAARQLGGERAQPIQVALGGEVSAEEVRLVLLHLAGHRN